jgi:hypothetical protein
MKEKTLVKFLIIVGIVSLIVISVSNILLRKTVFRFTSKLVPYILCAKDNEGNYILTKPTSFELCEKMDKIEDLVNVELCENFTNKEKVACLRLMEIAKNRINDCLMMLFDMTKTSVNVEDVEVYCKTLNATIH